MFFFSGQEDRARHLMSVGPQAYMNRAKISGSDLRETYHWLVDVYGADIMPDGQWSFPQVPYEREIGDSDTEDDDPNSDVMNDLIIAGWQHLALDSMYEPVTGQ